MRYTKEKLIETLRGAVISAGLYKAKSITGKGFFFFLDLGNDRIYACPTQEEAHKKFIKMDHDKRSDDSFASRVAV